MLTAICAFIAASANLPLVDESLAAIDWRLFHFERTMVVHSAVRFPHFFELMRQIYNTLSPQPFILVTILFAVRRHVSGWSFVLAWSVALIGCVAIFPLTPALGTPPYALDWIGVFNGARSGSLRSIDQSVLTGIITFPSFHAAGATVLACGWTRLRVLRWPMVALNVLVVVSAVLVGGHYIVDVIAGCAIGALAVWLSCKLTFDSMNASAAQPTKQRA